MCEHSDNFFASSHLPSWAHTLVEEDRVLNRPGERALCSSVKAKEEESDRAACSMRIEGN